ncbi:hypothetical protein C0J52_14066 [Blattella germanica]|nr:hypothetical protein C0J52_14066 [Blattella germanica]
MTYGPSCIQPTDQGPDIAAASSRRLRTGARRRRLETALIYGPVCGNNGEWRIRTNRELEQLMKNEDIVRFIKSRRLAWMGHVLIVRIDESRIPRRIMEWKPVGRRNKGRPRKRWVDEL